MHNTRDYIIGLTHQLEDLSGTGMRLASATVSIPVLTLGLLATHPAHATEAGLFAGPIGGSDIRSAYLPAQSGVYVGVIELDASYNGLVDQNGRPSAVRPASYEARLTAFYGLYVYPWKPLGGTIATSVSQGYDFISEQIGTRKQADHGFLDTYSDVLVWSKHIGPSLAPASNTGGSSLPYGLTVSTAYSMVFRDGRYRVTDLTVEGHDYFVYIPNMAMTYLMRPIFPVGEGTEISTRLFYDIPTRNNANGYQSGQVFDIDWGLSERFGKFQAGLTGNYASQTTPDIKNGVRVAPDGNYLQRASLGPVLTRDFPKIHASLKAKVTFDYLDRNTFGDRVTATVAMVFRPF